MKNIFRDFFTFNKRERNGVFVLLSIIFVLVLYLNISSRYINEESVDFSKFDKEVEVFQSSINEESISSEYPEKFLNAEVQSPKLNKETERFDFDPNNLAESDWKRLGLSDKQIKTIKNYESKGGRFRKKEDVKKMYCINEALYASLEPFIKIGRNDVNTSSVFVNEKVEIGSSFKSTNTKSFESIELNTADSAMLSTIKGIGPFYAKNIIKYRNSIGGFVNKQQLLEIWKFDQEKLSAIEKYISIDPSKIKKISINTCEARDLKSPYINWNLANAIVNYRKNHGKYKSVDEIKKTDLVDDELYRKIASYLYVEIGS